MSPGFWRVLKDAERCVGSHSRDALAGVVEFLETYALFYHLLSVVITVTSCPVSYVSCGLLRGYYLIGGHMRRKKKKKNMFPSSSGRFLREFVL